MLEGVQVKGHAGTVLAGRYRLLERVASGGMGTVHRALDESTNRVVAVKLVSTGPGVDERVERFRREARILADLTHPAVVGFIDFGTYDDGHYLVMEWLEGLDLAERLRQGVLGTNETLLIARQVAEALSSAHELGIVHRDVKPANVFLVGGGCDQVKVLDFGIALISGLSTGITRTGMTVGTPEYMPPEQARGERSMDARVDRYALACVVFQCLSGQPPFFGPSAAAVIAEVLLAETPRLSSRVAEVPPDLDDLVASMLAKDPQKRPASAGVIADALARIQAGLPTTPDAVRPAVSTDERRMATILGIGSGSAAAASAAAAIAGRLGRVQIAHHHDGYVIVFVGESALQAALEAASAARELAESERGLPLALVSGQTSVRHGPDGAFLSRAIELAAIAGQIRVDEATRSLIGGALDVQMTAAGLVVRGERQARPAAGSALIGREREMAALSTTLEAVLTDGTSHVVIVTAGPGLGKSRLVRELFERARAAPRPLAMLEAKAEELRRGTPYATLGSLVKRALGIAESAPRAEQRLALEQAIAPLASPDDARRVAEFVGAAAGLEPEQPSVELVAALRDPLLMHDQIERATIQLFSLLAARFGGVAIVLDDAHLSDGATLKIVARAHRRLGDAAVFFALFGRPELKEAAPAGLFEAASQWIQLGGLPRRAAERVVAAALGDRASPETIDRIVAHADGNPLFLQELCAARVDRGVATPAAPPNVLASVEARLLRLDPGARKILRAASVFGEAFWQGGVAALLGPDAAESNHLGEWLVHLVDHGLLVPRRQTRFAGQPELGFRHPLLREAAYGMLLPEDREEGHRRAAAWLTSAGERDSAVLGEHLLAAGSKREAARFFLEAARLSLARNDLGHAVRHAERALEAQLDDASRARAHNILCEAFFWRSEQERGSEHGRAALGLTSPGTQPWMDAAAALIRCLARRGDLELIDLAREVVRSARLSPTLWFDPSALPDIVSTALRAGLRSLAEDVLAAFGPGLARAEDPVGRAHILTCRSWQAMFDGDYVACIAYDTEVLRCMKEAGDLRQACLARVHVGYDNLILGVYQRAAEELAAAQQEAEIHGLDSVEQMAKHNLSLALHRLGESDRALELQRECLAYAIRSHNQLEEGHARHYLGIILFERGELAAAKAELSRVLTHMSTSALRWETLARLAAIALRQDDLEEARYKIEEAVMGIDQLKTVAGAPGNLRHLLVHHPARRLRPVERAGLDEAPVPEAIAVGKGTLGVFEHVRDGREACVWMRGKRRLAHDEVVEVHERIERDGTRRPEAVGAERRRHPLLPQIDVGVDAPARGMTFIRRAHGRTSLVHPV